MKDFEKNLALCIRSRFPLIVLCTLEEERAEKSIESVSETRDRACVSWDLSEGFRPIRNWNGALPQTIDPIAALDFIDSCQEAAIFVLKDFHECWEDAKPKRKLRAVSQRLKYSKKTIFVTTPFHKLPMELQDIAVVLDYPRPGIDELENVLTQLGKAPGVNLELAEVDRQTLLKAALGLSSAQAMRVFAKAIVQNGLLDENDVHVITDEKREIIKGSEALEFYPATESFSDVGGLEAIKEWLQLKGRAFSPEAEQYGLPAPKGVALIGIPGTGKSLTAKMIGSAWKLPLLRLDVGALFGSFIGQSEERARQALRLAESIAPCIVWIDEMEKALSHGGNDSGTSTRVFGTILTWMQEKKAPCFVVATANNMSKMPPELLRRGRFDEIFFLDLPNRTEREAIFKVHLRKRKRDPEKFNLKALVDASDGFVGAEIEQSIIDSMFLAFDEDAREFTTEDILSCIAKQVPLSVSQRETVSILRRWLQEGRARSASEPDKIEKAPLQVDPLQAEAVVIEPLDSKPINTEPINTEPINSEPEPMPAEESADDESPDDTETELLADDSAGMKKTDALESQEKSEPNPPQ